MKYKIISCAFAMTIILGSMSALANSGTGIDADPAASMDSLNMMVYCQDELEFKSYINDDAEVINTYQPGTIFMTDSRLFRDGKETDWATAIVKDQNSGGFCGGFFELSNVKPYGGKEDIEVTISDDRKDLTIRAAAINGEEYVYYSSDIDLLESLGDEMIECDLVVHMQAADHFNEDATVTLTGYIDGKPYDKYVVNVYGNDGIEYTTITIAPLDFSEIKDEIDYEQVLFLEDGNTEKVYFLKDGRVIDMNGYQVIGIADTSWQMHDGRVLSMNQ